MDQWQFAIDVNQHRNNPQVHAHTRAIEQLNIQILAKLQNYQMQNEAQKIATNQVVQNLVDQVSMHNQALVDIMNQMNDPIRDEVIHNQLIRDQVEVEADEELADLMYAAPGNSNLGKRKRMSKGMSKKGMSKKGMSKGMSKKRITMKKCMTKHMNWVKKSNRNRGYCRK